MPAYCLPSWKVEMLVPFLGVIALVTAIGLPNQAFPSAGTDLKISRDEITRRAETDLPLLGFQVDGYESELTFHEAFWGSIYMQRTLGTAGIHRSLRTENLPIYDSPMRWFKPLQKEGFSVDFALTGEVVSFSHTLMENAREAAPG